MSKELFAGIIMLVLIAFGGWPGWLTSIIGFICGIIIMVNDPPKNKPPEP